jgi:cytochrome c oxidase subunit 2
MQGLLLRLTATAVCVFATAGCSGWQSALDPQGPKAEHLANLIWTFTIICVVVWLLVMVVLGLAVVRRRADRPDPLSINAPRERRAAVIVAAAVVLTGCVVIALTVLSYYSQRKLYARDAATVTVKVTGYQWWWDVRYEDARPDRTFTTANEIHVPVGEPVTLKLAATDVIHSFWVPSLTGKQDLIPGQENEIQFTATRPGIYRGQCAEFCGLQHAHMGLFVIASPKEQFEEWRARQLAPAASPTDDAGKKGEELFVTKACVMCHTVRGTLAGSRVGPDLTHFGSRSYIAAATLPMSRGNIAAWIVDPQGIKPGVNMPNVKLEPEELELLVTYLARLQ